METNPTTPPTPPATPADFEARIAAERNRLLIEQNLEADLDGQRLAPLEAGDDAALDRVEAQINACRDRQYRIKERIELLEKRLAQAKVAEHDASLDALEARANRARELGEKLITVEYRKHATALASVATRLCAIDALIESTNRSLEKERRNPVGSPNFVRARRPSSTTVVVKKRVHIDDPRHPNYGIRDHVTRAPQGHGTPDFMLVVLDPEHRSPTDQRVPLWAEIDVEEDVNDIGHCPTPIHLELVLPGLEPPPRHQNTAALWDCKYPVLPEGALDALLAELDATPTRTPKSRATTTDQTTGDSA